MDFEARLKKLNEEQKRAVTETEGPVMVIAGPGTGKTEIIGMRTAYIVKEASINPASILITTFTEAGVTAIKKRLLEIMGTDSYKVNVTTLHGFCSQVINEFPEKFVFAKNIKQITDIERIETIREIISSQKLKYLTTFGNEFHYLPDVLKKIQELKREDITPEILDEHLEVLEKELKEEHSISKRTGKPPKKWQDKEKLVFKNRELSLIYKKYQEKLKKEGLYDYEDMILFVVNKFKEDDELLANYQEQYLYIMLDEYQDTNRAQNEIVELLTSFETDEKPNIFVVGDDDQSIYRFQGASLENILFFAEKYKVKSPVVLKQNYRSNQNILDASFSLIEKNTNRVGAFLEGIDKKLHAQKEDGEKMDVIEFATGDAEKFFIYKKIKELLKDGVNPNEIAVFSRTNYENREMAEFLAKRDVSVVFSSSQNIIQNPVVRMFLEYLYVVNDPYNDQKLANLLSFGSSGIDTLDAYKIIRHLKNKEGGHLFETLLNEENLKNLEIKNTKSVLDFVKKIAEFKKLSHEKTLIELSEIILKESGFLDWLMEKAEKVEYLSHISALFSEIKELNKEDKNIDIEKFLKKLELYEEYGIEIKEEPFLLDKDGVRVMTAHASKGLEFEYVFIQKACDKVWGNRQKRENIKLPENLLLESKKLTIEKNEDERRLFFVALTRAKKKAYITYADEYISGNNTEERAASQFIEEIEKERLNLLKGEDIKMDKEEFLLGKLKTKEKDKDEEKEYLKSLLKDYKLSVTSMENYLECPRKFKFRNLIRIPEAKTKHQALGTAYHKALERFFLEFKNTGKLPSESLLESSYKNALESEILSKKDREDVLEAGLKGIKGYYEKYHDEMIPPEAVEYNFTKHEVHLDKAHLTGKIDKIEKINDKDVRIIDYKTGKTRSDNEIAGNTKNSDGKLKRQIVFYKILCDLDERFKFNMTEGELDFVQGKDDKYKKVRVAFTNEDILKLKEIIKDMYNNIMELKFECQDPNGFCDYCKQYTKI